MLPSLSVAAALIVTTSPTRKFCPLAGAVRATAGGALVTVTVTALVVVRAPALSSATAVRL